MSNQFQNSNNLTEPDTLNSDINQQKATPEKQKFERPFSFIKHTLAERNDQDDTPTEDEPEEDVLISTKKLKKPKRRFGKLIFIIISCVCIVLITLIMLCLNDIFALFKPKGDTVNVTISEGAYLSEISDTLSDSHIIDYPFVFQQYVKFNKAGNSLQAGTFQLNAGMSYQDIISTMQNPQNNLSKTDLTIPEGTNMFGLSELAQKLPFNDKNDLISELNNPKIYSKYEFYKYLTDERLSNAYFPMEGFIFPDTYHTTQSTSASDLANTIFQNTDKKYKFIYSKLNKNQNLYDIITIASIIQQEAGFKEDMPLISSVIYNRLNNNRDFPTLGCDPTKKYSDKISEYMNATNYKSTFRPDTYNTHICRGLPAGPICNPSIEAIEAALNPAESNYYFFCTDLKTRQCFYATTLDEHYANLKKAGLT